MNKRGIRVLVMMIGVCCGHESCRAQASEGAFRWLVSSDNGTTWSPHAEVPQNHASVLVRLEASWSGMASGQRTEFARTFFDATIRGVACGELDSVSGFSPGLVRWGPGGFGAPRPQRHGDVIKIDPAGDDDPPGLGARWTTVDQGWPGAGMSDPVLDNPVRIFQYTLLLDGSAGTREIRGVWGHLTPQGQPQAQIWFDDPATQIWQTAVNNIPMTVSDASITVVPAPGILGVLTLLALPRRRQ